MRGKWKAEVLCAAMEPILVSIWNHFNRSICCYIGEGIIVNEELRNL